MRIVVALGGNALVKRGGSISIEAQRKNVRLAVEQLARIAVHHDLVIVHGNGPQIGQLALQSMNMPSSERFPIDVMDAQTVGMIGYMIQQELGNLLSKERICVTLLTMIEVSADDPAFSHPDKPIGPIYDKETAIALGVSKGWSMAADGPSFRRVVSSPKPIRLLEMQAVQWLLDKGAIVICAGGGGIPVVTDKLEHHHGVEAVVDKDRSAALVARELNADLLVIATDVSGVFLDWGTPASRMIRSVNPNALETLGFAAGSMGPKVEAACDYAKQTGHRAVIGALEDIEKMIEGIAGTSVCSEYTELLEESKNQ